MDKEREKMILTKDEAFSQELVKFMTINATNPLERFLEMIMYEIREVKSFIEAIEGRKEAERRKCELRDKIAEKESDLLKLESGTFSLKSFFKTGSK
jgi:cell shape-determining protein MreC